MSAGTLLWPILLLASAAMTDDPRHGAATDQSPAAEPLPIAPMTTSGNEPKGVRVRPKDGAGEAVLVPWGATHDQIEELLGAEEGFEFSCTIGSDGGGHCMMFDWIADFGDESLQLSPMLWVHRWRFFRYSISIDPDEHFETVSTVLHRALGKPSKVENSPVQNMMGATFISRERDWRLAHTDVWLWTRLSRVDDGSLMVTYRPLAPPEKPDAARAPF